MKDKIKIQKVIMYIERIKKIYEKIKDLEDDELLELDESFALTQYLTNIDSIFGLITSDEIASKQFSIGIRPLKTCRNIASHDYDNLDWRKLKKICNNLISDSTSIILSECLTIAQKDEDLQKSYSRSFSFTNTD